MVKLEEKVKKKRSKTLIFSLIAFAIICISASYIKDKNSVNVYNVENTIDDNALFFKNLKLVEVENNLYIEKGCTINAREGNNCSDIKNINIEWYIDNRKIYDKSFEKMDGVTVEFINIPTILRNIRIKSNSILTMKITCLISGDEREFNEEVKLKDCKGECAIYD